MDVNKDINELEFTVAGNMIGPNWTDRNGLRHHVWLEAKDGEPVRPFAIRSDTSPLTPPTLRGKPVLYRNPPSGVKPRGDGYFHTRHLNADGPANRAVVDEVLRRCDVEGMFAKAVAANRTNEENRAREQVLDMVDRTRAKLRERSAGPDPTMSLDAQIAAQELCDLTDDVLHEVVNAIRCA